MSVEVADPPIVLIAEHFHYLIDFAYAAGLRYPAGYTASA
jgi:hypothetical protein